MTLSTHVLDTAAGKPAEGIAVRLEHQGRVLATSRTDADGRVRSLHAEALGPGTYQLRFAVAEYFQKAGTAGFYSEILVQFEIAANSGHYHVPLLLSPFGYTTYRGS